MEAIDVMETRIIDAKEILLKRCRDQLQNLENELAGEKNANQDLETQLKTLNKQTARLSSELEDAQDACNTLQFENTELQETLEALRLKMAQLKQGGKEARLAQESSLQQKERELSGLKQRVWQLEEELKAKQDSLEEWDSSITLFEEKLAGVAGENNRLKASLEKYIGNCERLLRDNEGLAQERTTFTGELKKLRSECEAKANTNEELLRKLQGTERDRESAQEKLLRKLQGTERDRESAQEELRQSQKELEEGAHTQESLEHQLNSANLLLQQQQQASTAALAQQSAEALVLRTQVRELSGQSELLQNDCARLSHSYSALKATLKAKECEWSSTLQAFQGLTARYAVLEQEFQAQLDSTSGEIEGAREFYRTELSKQEGSFLLRVDELELQHRRELLEQAQELSRTKEHCQDLLSCKEEEGNALDQDRLNLQDAARELNSALEHRKHALETLQKENDALSAQLQASSGLQTQLDLRQQDLDDLKSRFDAKLKEKVHLFYEKVGGWKARLRQESLFLQQCSEGVPEFSAHVGPVVERLESTIKAML